MAIVGLKMIRLALVDEKQQIIKGDEGLSETGIYEVDILNDLGTKTANITNLEGSSEKVWGNNQTTDVIIGAANPQVALDFNNLNFEVGQKVLGNKKDGKGGYAYCGIKPRVAMLIETTAVKTGKSVFFGFGNGICTKENQNIGTNTEKQTRETDQLKYEALSTKAFNGEPYKTYYEGDEKFSKDTMFKEVFGGYVVIPSVSGDSESH